MKAVTREQIFNESDKRFPNFTSSEHHARSLGFEAGAHWVSQQEEALTDEQITAEANNFFPCDLTDKIETLIATWRREGFVGGAKWVNSL